MRNLTGVPCSSPRSQNGREITLNPNKRPSRERRYVCMPKQTTPDAKKTPAECREAAQDCRAQAGRARDEAERKEWLMLAVSWDLLAAERDRE